MKITIKETNLTLTDRERADIDRHVAKLKRRLKRYEPAVTLDIEIARTTNHHRKGPIYKAEATLLVEKKSCREEAIDEDVSTAFETCRKGLEREIEKFKSSREEKNYRQARKFKKMKQMTPLAWRGTGREEEQQNEIGPLEEEL